MARIYPPKHFDKEQKKKWTETIGKIKAVGTFNIVDLDLVETYVTAWTRYNQSIEHLKKNGEVSVSSRSGAEYPSAYINVALSNWNQMVKLANLFGLTPMARFKLKLEDQPNVDPNDDFSEFTD